MKSASSSGPAWLAVCLVIILASCSNEQSDKVSRNRDEDSTGPATISTDESIASTVTTVDRETAQIEPSRDDGTEDASVTVSEMEQLPDLEQALAKSAERKEERDSVEEVQPREIQTIDIPASWKRLSQQQEVWLDMENKQVIAAGHICLNAGPLEVFICPRHTKEHESVISVNALSSQIHAALLALGAEPGHPVKWEDQYQPASGPVIKITVIWQAEPEKRKISRRGQEMVRNIVTDEVMQQDWVFGGSQVYTDPESGESFYYGDSGELVCLSNFSTATMDVPVESSDANDGLLFAANTDRIPPVGTKVYVVFEPLLDAAKE